MLEVLHSPLVLFRFIERFECPEVTALAGLGVGFAGIKPVLAGFEFSNHREVSFRSGGLSLYAKGLTTI